LIGDHAIGAEQVGQLDPQSLAVQSVGVLIGSSSFIAAKLPERSAAKNSGHDESQ